MFRKIILAVALVSALAVVGCGGTSTATSATSAAPAKTAQQAGTGDYNMDTLASEFTDEYNTEPPYISDVTCILTGPQAATCMGDSSSGVKHGQHVQISLDGTHWNTLGD